MARKPKRNRPAPAAASSQENGSAPKSSSAASSAGFPLWGYAAAAASAVLLLLFAVYRPALQGPFLFDDLYLPYAKPNAAHIPLKLWLGVRPVLGLSYWTDFHLWGRSPYPFHVTNLLLHFCSAAVLFFVFRKLLQLGDAAQPVRNILAAFGAALFLLHPIQTEVAGYVASRSEALSVLFFLTAFCSFLYRRTAAISWTSSALVLFFFLLAIGSKEHTVTLPALLLLTDYFWNPGFSFSGARANARLYVPVVTAGLLGALFVFRYIASDPMIGFHIKGLGPAAYFFTQCRAVFEYLRLFLLPYGQSADYDFAVSQTPTDHGALVALAALLLLIAAAVLFRKSYPFAAYGFLGFLLLLSPTSSFIPINDVLAERRLYLPFFCLVVMLFEPLRRLRARPFPLAAALALVCALAAFFTWQRAYVWGSVLELFRDAAAKSPGKVRVHIGFANALYHEGQCQEAVQEYQRASQLQQPDYILYFNMAAAYTCARNLDQAAEMLRRSNALKPQPLTQTELGKVLCQADKIDAGLAAFQSAIDMDYRFAPAYAYRGTVYAAIQKNDLALQDFTDCLRLDPANQLAQQGLQALNQNR